MTLHEWTHSEATLKALAPGVYKQLEANIIKAEQRKREAWQRASRLAQHSAGQYSAGQHSAGQHKERGV